MKTLWKTLLRSVAVLLLLAIGILLYILFGNLSVHKDRILDMASEATGFEIAADGPFELDIGKEISLSASEMAVANPDRPGDDLLASIGTLRVVVDTWSILSGPLEINGLEIANVDIRLREDNDGTANWIVKAETSEETEPTPPGPDPVLHGVDLGGIRVVHEAADGTRIRFETSKLRLSRTSANQYDYELNTRVGDAEPDTTLNATGSLQFGKGLTDISSARIDFSEASLSMSGATRVDATFSGFATADLSADRPAVEVDVNVAQLAVDSADDEQPAAPDQAAAALFFDTTPLAASWLDTLDLVADVDIANADLNGNALSKLHLATKIEDSAMTMAPVEFTLGDGKFSGLLALVPANDTYALEISAKLDNIRFVQLADDDQDPATVPPLNAALTLAGAGASLHEIMASSNGKLSGRQDGGQLNLQAMGALFSDFLTSIVRTLNPLAEERTYTNLECGIFEIDITDGVANIEKLALQSDRLTIVGSGNINFETEALDLTLNTKSREGLGISVGDVANSFIKLGGTLKEPALGIDAVGSVTTTGAAVATGGLSLLAKGLWDRVSSEVDMCDQPDDTPHSESQD